MSVKHLVSALILLSMTHASYALFCPTNFSIIQEGDSIDKVTSLCGKPDSQETKEVKTEGPQEWSYFIPQTVGTITSNPATGTMKTQIAFDANSKVVNINVNGIGVGSTTICNGANVSLGDTQESVKRACGDPVFVNKQQETSNTTNQLPATKVTTFTYSNTTPQVKLTFENGKLVKSQ